uniref:Nucleolar protein-like protein with NOL1/NOP2/sun family putative RNA methylase domain n=1 Tax=Babesia bovis TaxID=5865 RepID=S6BF37_BABBO|nr:nucleolar protein-like protein with NOL1/NOP2/sun family putative RNA methylase domain [Babesia bovis]
MEKLDLIASDSQSDDYSDDGVEQDEFDLDTAEPEGIVEDGDEGYLDDIDSGDLHSKVDLTDLSAVKSRIESICGLLSNWSAASKAGIATKKRGSYLRELQEMVTAYYGYSDEMSDYFLKLFSPTEAIQFFEANERPLPMTLRVNTLKTRRKELAAALIARGANVDPVGDWSKEGLVVHSSQVPIGATPEYLAGHYMMQSAASLIPVLALSPKDGEKVLDIAAAPGGKTTHIAQMMNNGGILYANDFNKERCTALVANIHRLGITNTIVTKYDRLDLKGILPPLDRVLCDAPCSGLGVISKDPSVKVKRTLMDLKQNADLQKRLLLCCIDMLSVNVKKGNCVVYSTCSISVEENEQVIDYALRMRDVKLVPLGVEAGSPALSSFRGRHFHPSIGQHARRFYPHLHNLDGFFVAKLVKLSSKIPTLTKRYREPRRNAPEDSTSQSNTDEVKISKAMPGASIGRQSHSANVTAKGNKHAKDSHSKQSAKKKGGLKSSGVKRTPRPIAR